MSFSKYNKIFGIFCGLIAFVIYSLTVEPTASYWDCAEYISTSAKLQIGHPPGAPLFQMLGAIFSILALNNEQIAYTVNMMSVTSSALTIIFLFWSISLLAKKILGIGKTIKKNELMKVFGSSFLGALTFTFTDSFWFNAVEAEVYAMATLILSVLFWLGLKWESEFYDERSDKWLILISFVIGLSFGVHFMGLLAIPSIGLIYYFKKYSEFNFKKFLIANIISVSILLFIFKLLLPSTLKLFGYLEVFFVNDLRLPFNSGTIFTGFLIVSTLYYLFNYSIKNRLYLFNTILLCLTFIFIGFSSWLMIPIRSNADTVINENSPKDARSLLAYYNLEQYPETYLFYGPMFTDAFAGQDLDEPYKDDKPKYEKDYTLNRYVIVNDWKNGKINSNKNHRGFFPRMWSDNNALNYIKYYGFLNFEIKREFKDNSQIEEIVNDFKNEINNGDVSAEEFNEFLSNFSSYINIEKPSFLSNLNYFLSFQLGYMYFRYFMWNFSGRQNDNQWKFDVENGNWLSGIKYIDEIRLGSQENLPSDSVNNKSRNIYFMIPFILGILGLFMLLKTDFRSFWPVFLLFIFTGIALKFYLNERVFEPRERDYALVGSFYAYSIFIGLSFLFFFKKMKNYLNENYSSLISLIIVSVCPLLLGFNNWDDHDRSNRYTAQTLAKAYLDSIEEDKQSIIFTIGDNDTFALWYAQEIEEHRTDVRTINTSLIATDWYMDQMKRKAYKSDPIKSQLTHKQYAYGVRDYIKYEELIDSVRWDLKDFMNWISSDNERTKYKFLLEQYGYEKSDLSEIPKFTQNMIFYPTNKIRFYVNKENVLKSGVVKKENENLIVDYIDIDLPESGLYKNQILMLDILSKNDWERPIYFTGGSYKDSEYLWMKNYLQLDGLVYKLVPIETPLNPENPYQMGRIDANTMYEIVKKWKWGNSESDKIYHDPETRKNSITFRSNLHRLAEEFISLGDNFKALEILDLSFDKLPIEYFGYYSLSEPYINSYYKIGEIEKSRNLFKKIEEKYHEQINYYSKSMILNPNKFNLEIHAENIFTYNERLRGLLENQINIGEEKFVSEFIIKYMKSTEIFKDLYGEYDFYNYMNSFIKPLYVSEKVTDARNLYEKIKSLIISRLNTLISANDNSNSEYINDLITQELEKYENLINIISKFENKKYLDSEIIDYKKYYNQF
ncbi:DUF2723 domain-containing protein [Flavobacteriales bacterium]|nr:DUF2723 domain-containing protein [Flavobacteriales bacterium]